MSVVRDGGIWEDKQGDRVTMQTCVVAAGTLPGGDELEVSLRKAYREEFVQGIERQALPADKFAIPKGYTEAKGEDED